MLDIARRARNYCLCRFKAAVYPLIGLLVRKLSVRFMDDIVPLARLEAAQARLEAFRWDHIAMARRLAALEDHVEKLLRQQAASNEQQEEPAPPAAVPFPPTEAQRAVNEMPARLQRVA
jgi:hypothetical protein